MTSSTPKARPGCVGRARAAGAGCHGRSRLRRRSRQVQEARRREPHARARVAVDRVARRAHARQLQDRLREGQPDRAAEGPGPGLPRHDHGKQGQGAPRACQGQHDAGRRQGLRRREVRRARPRERRDAPRMGHAGPPVAAVRQARGRQDRRARRRPRLAQAQELPGTRVVRRERRLQGAREVRSRCRRRDHSHRQRARRDQLREGRGHARVHRQRPEDDARCAGRRGRACSSFSATARATRRRIRRAVSWSVEKPKDGAAWVVDFNKAYNPPCAFSAYTTCPLPPPQNWLKSDVSAGERYTGRKS